MERERRRLTLRESLRKAAVPLAIAGAITSLGMMADMGIGMVKATQEADKMVLPNASPEELANARSLRELELISITLRRNLVEGSTSVVLMASSLLLARATRENKRNQNGTQDLQSSTT